MCSHVLSQHFKTHFKMYSLLCALAYSPQHACDNRGLAAVPFYVGPMEYTPVIGKAALSLDPGSTW